MFFDPRVPGNRLLLCDSPKLGQSTETCSISVCGVRLWSSPECTNTLINVPLAVPFRPLIDMLRSWMYAHTRAHASRDLKKQQLFCAANAIAAALDDDSLAVATHV